MSFPHVWGKKTLRHLCLHDEIRTSKFYFGNSLVGVIYLVYDFRSDDFGIAYEWAGVKCDQKTHFKLVKVINAELGTHFYGNLSPNGSLGEDLTLFIPRPFNWVKYSVSLFHFLILPLNSSTLIYLTPWKYVYIICISYIYSSSKIYFENTV